MEKKKNSRNKARYDDDLPGYQEGMYCMRNKTENYGLDEYYSGALVWGFDGSKEFFTITVIPSFKDTFAKYINDINNNTDGKFFNKDLDLDLAKDKTSESIDVDSVGQKQYQKEQELTIKIIDIGNNTYKVTFSKYCNLDINALFDYIT